MKCHILFSGKNKENIVNLLSAELAKRMVKVKTNVVKGKGVPILRVINTPVICINCTS